MATENPEMKYDVEKYILGIMKRTRSIFQADEFDPLFDTEEISKMTKRLRSLATYSQFVQMPSNLSSNNTTNQLAIPSNIPNGAISVKNPNAPEHGRVVPKKLDDKTIEKVVERVMESIPNVEDVLKEDVKIIAEKAIFSTQGPKPQLDESVVPFSHGLVPRKAVVVPKPVWHAPWKLMRVIAGHTGWVRCLTFEPGNSWFATGSCDRMIKIWDLASGTLKLSLTGHISTVRGLVCSPHHPYLFSCGEDKQIKCWDLEQNKAIRHYHGHLHSIYAIAQHPTIDVLVTGSRDATLRVWDIRTKVSVFTLVGHKNTVASVVTQATDPQIVSGSHDSQIRLWDLRMGRSYCTLTNHKKSVRALLIHPKLNCLCSASAGNIKQWKLPDGELIQTMKEHNTILNALAMNEDDVLVSGGDDGTMHFWDWKTGYNFDAKSTILQPGSLEPEAGIFAMGFDLSGSRLITCEADKSIKIYKEDEEATEETHPIKLKSNIVKVAGY